MSRMTGCFGDGSVLEAKLATGAVTEDKLGAGAVTEGKLGALAVTSGKIGAGAVVAGKLANGAVDTAARVANGILTTTQFAAAAGITLAQLAAGITSKVVWLAAPDAIGDWIASSVTADTNVDLSDDGVPAGATAVILGYEAASIYLRYLYVCSAARASGAGDMKMQGNGNQSWRGCFIVDVDANRHIHARFDSNQGMTANACYVLGYII